MRKAPRTLLTLFSVCGFILGFSQPIWADASLKGGEETRISCDGKRLNLTRESGTVARASCQPATAQVAKPAISPAGGSFSSSIQVTLSTSTTGATIRYTIDGTDPSAAAAQYTAPFTLTKTATVKAQAFKSGMTPSAITSATFTLAAVTPPPTSPPPPTTPPVPAPAPDPKSLEIGVDINKYEAMRQGALRGEYDRLCTDAEHDENKWHPLVNVEKKCHYDHQHGDDPTLLNDVFGEPGAWFGKPGQSISYPWQTFKIPAGTTNRYITPEQAGTQLENQHGHKMYYWVVRRNQPCDANGYCVKDFRIQFHGDTTFMHAETRYHSIAMEVRACKDVNDLSTCGIIRTGGWMDYRRLFAPPIGTISPGGDCGNPPNDAAFAKYFISLSADTLFDDAADFQGRLDEFRCHQVLTPEVIARQPKVTDNTALMEWWGHGLTDVRFNLFVYDPISNTIETAPGSQKLQVNYNCAEGNPSCRYNNSIFSASIGYILPVNSYLGAEMTGDLITDLSLDKKHYYTRWGDRNTSCTTVGLDCIPIEYNNLRLKQQPGQGLEGFSHKRCVSCAKIDHDITPPDRPSWITWFYDMGGDGHAH